MQPYQYQQNPVNDFYFRNAQQSLQPSLPWQPQYNFPPQQTAQPPVIHANWVTSIEEAKAAQMDFVSTNIYLDTGTGKIYLKRMGNDGKPQFLTYTLENEVQENPLAEINERLSNIENFLGGLKHESVSGNAGNEQSGPVSQPAATEQNEPDGATESAGIPKNAGNDFWKKRR